MAEDKKKKVRKRRRGAHSEKRRLLIKNLLNGMTYYKAFFSAGYKGGTTYIALRKDPEILAAIEDSHRVNGIDVSVISAGLLEIAQDAGAKDKDRIEALKTLANVEKFVEEGKTAVQGELTVVFQGIDEED